MSGKVRTQEKCEVCGGKYKLTLVGQSADLTCPACKTRPKTYYIDARSMGLSTIWRDNKTGALFRTYESAYQQLEEMRRQIKNHIFDPHDYKQLDVEQLKLKNKAKVWLERIALDKSFSYVRHSETEMNLHIIPIFGETDVRDIRTHHIRDFYYHLVGKKLSPKSIKNILATLKTFLKSLDDLIQRFPNFPSVKVPEKAGGWLNQQKQAEVLDHIPERHRLIFDSLVELSCRPQEAVALKKKDLIDGEVCIERAFDEKGNLKSRKSGKVLYRSVSPRLWQRLVSHSQNALPEAWLFLDEFGKPYSQARLYDIWCRACKNVEVKISLYAGTRRSRASQRRLELEKGIVEQISRELGNTKTVAEKHYIKGKKDAL